ncbi:MAG: acyl-CoA dehydrogenase [Bdellovibrionales bacterium RBG_16_40_8]|nr:MAG: acyl-CoA dehydrogenase [Bdellovibrionales bacterium RBG_16_40_8]
MKRKIYSEEHESFRDIVKRFIKDHIASDYSLWEKQGQVPTELYKLAGKQGLLCPSADEKYGGSGGDFLFSAIIIEELYRQGFHSVFFALHSDIAFPYISELGSAEQKEKWLAKCVSGENILALAMTEPNYGSDIANLQTRAEKKDNFYVLNGSKTFISNGQIANLVIVAARTSLDKEKPHKGISLFVVEADTLGFKRGQKLEKIGLHAQDTSELFFENCKIPTANMLGAEGTGFYSMMKSLQQERLVIAIGAAAAAKGCLDLTLQYVKERQVFGKPLSHMQNTRFELAEIATQVQLAESFLDDLIPRHMAREDIVKEVSMAKYWMTDMQSSVADRCLQLFGGYGYSLEYPIARQYVDARVQKIYGGTNEIMKEMIASRLM